MYTQKESYFLVRNGYKLTKNGHIITYLHKSENRVKVSLQHIWKSFRLRRQIFTKDLGWFDIDPKFIKTHQVDRLASNYFQTDDMYYSLEVRSINKKRLPELIESLNLK